MKDEIEKIFTEFNEKKQEYGDVDKVAIQALNALFPDFIPVEKYSDTIFSVRVLEKLSRIASTNITNEKKLDAFKDVVGYSLLGCKNLVDKNNNDK